MAVHALQRGELKVADQQRLSGELEDFYAAAFDLHFPAALRPAGRHRRPALALRRQQRSRRWDDRLTCRCPLCGSVFVPAAQIAESIRNGLWLPDSVDADARLLAPVQTAAGR